MSTTQQFEEAVKDIADQLEALGQAVNPQKIEETVRTVFADVIKQPDFLRKMRFGSPEETNLIAAKFRRHGFNQADIEFLYDMQTSLKGQRNGDNGAYLGPSQELEGAFNAVSDAYYLTQEEVRAIDKQAIDNLFARVPKTRAARKSFFAEYKRATGAMDTAESGYGSQLIGAQYVGDLWDGARAESRIFALLDQFEMTAPVAYLPVEADLPEMLYVGESTSASATNYDAVMTGSNRVTVDAKKLIIQQIYSGEMEEDSIIPYIPFLRRQAALALAHYSDSLVLNGDTTNASTGNINLDDADPADTKHYLAYDGIRHVGLVDNTANGLDVAGAVSLNTYRDLRGLMIDRTNLFDWGHPTNRDDLVFITDTVTGDRTALLDEIVVAKQMLGANADLLNGEIARILGHPVISSMAMGLTEADGKISATPANNTKGQIAAFNRRGFKVGMRRRVKFETERLVRTDQTVLSWSLRMGMGRFTATGNVSGIESAAVAYDISL